MVPFVMDPKEEVFQRKSGGEAKSGLEETG